MNERFMILVIRCLYLLLWLKLREPGVQIAVLSGGIPSGLENILNEMDEFMRQ